MYWAFQTLQETKLFRAGIIILGSQLCEISHTIGSGKVLEVKALCARLEASLLSSGMVMDFVPLLPLE